MSIKVSLLLVLFAYAVCGQRLCDGINCIVPLTPECPADQATDLYIPHENCNQFYVCFMGTLTEFNCPGGLEWNAETNICDWPINAGCSIKPPTEAPEEVPQICPADSSELITVADEDDCGKFNVCFEGQSAQFSCQEKMEFSPSYSKCFPISDCGCTAKKNGSPSSSVPSSFCRNNNMKILPHPTSCLKYVACLGSLPFVFDCPNGQEFNTKYNLCMRISSSGCLAQKGCEV